jgi:hypothetical protein
MAEQPAWLTELRRQKGSIPWLAARTGRHQNTVYRYSWGLRTPDPTWLKEASKALGMGQK